MFADAETEEGTESGEFSRDRTFLQVLLIKMADEFADDETVHGTERQGLFSRRGNIGDELVEVDFVAANCFRGSVADVAEVMQEFSGRGCDRVRSGRGHRETL